MSACSSASHDRPIPAKQKKPAIEISDACEKFSYPEPVPKAKGENAKSLLIKTGAALGRSNKRHVASRDCQRRQREDFAKG